MSFKPRIHYPTLMEGIARSDQGPHDGPSTESMWERRITVAVERIDRKALRRCLFQARAVKCPKGVFLDGRR
ncbi:hypothetical protein BOSEA31B_20700 [Hyphomicrobiales bacterium]|nr:hypothetical protein BOSEA31B_20700 [Hyphomicrobiales bacterium]CAH1702804.1 hypothetical protein BOSEA1005_30676 [Hyphomicrobiales bacterium]CAI0346993.1 hypothetical protein BO1005MUT1_530169 [Hyphomicrobiales bacterium]